MTAKMILEENGFSTTDGNIYVLYDLDELKQIIVLNGDNITFKNINATVYAPTEDDKIDFVLNYIMSCYTTCYLS